MMQTAKRLAFCAFAGGLVFSGLMYWYAWSARAMTPGEINSVIARIEAQTHSPGGRIDLAALRAFLEQDDGKPFYTVNLYRFHTRANYGPGSALNGTGAEAYDRFSKQMIRLLAAHASHPVFGSFAVQQSPGGWDRIVIVRYRSRRDIADIFASDAFAAASEHKWAALQINDRMLVQATHLPKGGHVIAFLSALAAAMGFWLTGRRRTS
jgi:uncharacterized protein (DUF1330 family)